MAILIAMNKFHQNHLTIIVERMKVTLTTAPTEAIVWAHVVKTIHQTHRLKQCYVLPTLSSLESQVFWTQKRSFDPSLSRKHIQIPTITITSHDSFPLVENMYFPLKET